ncbi:oligopeptide transporter permease [Salmonella enterica subsp. enterica]|uniref:Oligopeptide transporter permease n=1 Tax=Salmonella enterica I TaxID=59201 RepID=A0A447U272_SALET|nr:oligopeptide transporter permease [Salmonella enterica subsp. enterica]
MSTASIVIRHIVPNVLGVVVVYASLLVPSMILFESFLSFLGLGTQEPLSSWGSVIERWRKFNGSLTVAAAVSGWLSRGDVILF